MLTADELRTALTRMPGDHITEEYMRGRIKSVDFHRIGATVTLCSITLDNGYSVRGESACVDPANYNQAVGENLSSDDAFRKLWPIFGFLLAEKRFHA
jgi:hypothetical protein